MIFCNPGFSFPPGGSAFGGYVADFSQVPGGIMGPPPLSLLGLGGIMRPPPSPLLGLGGIMEPPPSSRLVPGYPPIGAELPSVDPFDYPGVRFGPAITIIGPHPPHIPPGAGTFDPNLVVPGAPTLVFRY